MMMAVILLSIYFKCCFSIPRSLHISIKYLQDFPKIPIELMDWSMNLILWYFEERSRVSCRYLLRFLSASMIQMLKKVKDFGEIFGVLKKSTTKRQNG